MESDPTLKEFSLAKFKIMSLLSLVVLVASNTWEERPQGKMSREQKWNSTKVDPSWGEGVEEGVGLYSFQRVDTKMGKR